MKSQDDGVGVSRTGEVFRGEGGSCGEEGEVVAGSGCLGGGGGGWQVPSSLSRRRVE